MINGLFHSPLTFPERLSGLSGLSRSAIIGKAQAVEVGELMPNFRCQTLLV